MNQVVGRSDRVFIIAASLVMTSMALGTVLALGRWGLEEAGITQAEPTEKLDAFGRRPLALLPQFVQAQQWEDQGRYAEALEVFTGLLDVYPDHFQLHMHLSLCYLATGQLEACKEHTMRAKELMPVHLQTADMMLALAQLLIHFDEPAEAFDCITRAQELGADPATIEELQSKLLNLLSRDQ